MTSEEFKIFREKLKSGYFSDCTPEQRLENRKLTLARMSYMQKFEEDIPYKATVEEIQNAIDTNTPLSTLAKFKDFYSLMPPDDPDICWDRF